jgi:hypothetical protein
MCIVAIDTPCYKSVLKKNVFGIFFRKNGHTTPHTLRNHLTLNTLQMILNLLIFVAGAAAFTKPLRVDYQSDVNQLQPLVVEPLFRTRILPARVQPQYRSIVNALTTVDAESDDEVLCSYNSLTFRYATFRCTALYVLL